MNIILQAMDQFAAHRQYVASQLTPLPGDMARSNFAKCYACWEAGPEILCQDAGFKVYHRKCAGSSIDSVKEYEGGVINVAHKAVEDCVERPSDPSSSKSDCQTEYAADNDRAKHTRYFDINGLAVILCSHQVCLYGTFIIGHGERYGYYDGMVRQLLKDFETNNLQPSPSLTLFYDVGCRYDAHLDKLLPPLPQPIQVVTGKFHGPTHSMPCRLQFEGKYRAETGNSTGEQCEPFFGFMNKGHQVYSYNEPGKFARYVDGRALQWNLKQQSQTPNLLVREWKRAEQTIGIATQQLPAAYSALWESDPAPGVPLTHKREEAANEITRLVSAGASNSADDRATLVYMRLLLKYKDEVQKVRIYQAFCSVCLLHHTKSCS